MSTQRNQLRPDESRLIIIPAGSVSLDGELAVPPEPRGVVIFAHGAGGCRHNARLQAVADQLRQARLGTLLFDLLTPEEDATEAVGRHLRFNMGLLTQRLICAAHWLASEDEARHLRLGILGFETGGGAALVAAADLPDEIGAVVVQSGRVDLAGGALRRVKCPTLFIVDEQDEAMLALNEETHELLPCEKRLCVLRAAAGKTAQSDSADSSDSSAEATRLTAEWFTEHLGHVTRSRVRLQDWGRAPRG